MRVERGTGIYIYIYSIIGTRSSVYGRGKPHPHNKIGERGVACETTISLLFTIYHTQVKACYVSRTSSVQAIYLQ